MVVLVATVIGMVIWVVLWALGTKGFDAFMITAAVVLLGASLRLLVPYLPGGGSRD